MSSSRIARRPGLSYRLLWRCDPLGGDLDLRVDDRSCGGREGVRLLLSGERYLCLRWSSSRSSRLSLLLDRVLVSSGLRGRPGRIRPIPSNSFNRSSTPLTPCDLPASFFCFFCFFFSLRARRSSGVSSLRFFLPLAFFAAFSSFHFDSMYSYIGSSGSMLGPSDSSDSDSAFSSMK